jgi:hypothetical protein
LGFADQAVGCRGQGRVLRVKIAFCQKLFEWHKFDATHSSRRMWRVRENAHVESGRPPGNRFPDAAKSNNPQRFPADIIAPTIFPFATLHGDVDFMHAPRE